MKRIKIFSPINFAEIESVEIKEGTPHCIYHGAMNKMNSLEDGGGYWRCVSSYSEKTQNLCRTGCLEKRLSVKKFLIFHAKKIWRKWREQK